jgi:hypothetical protein
VLPPSSAFNLTFSTASECLSHKYMDRPPLHPGLPCSSRWKIYTPQLGGGSNGAIIRMPLRLDTASDHQRAKSRHWKGGDFTRNVQECEQQSWIASQCCRAKFLIFSTLVISGKQPHTSQDFHMHARFLCISRKRISWNYHHDSPH